MTPTYLKYLKHTGTTLKSSDGKPIEIWEISVPDGDACFSEWACNFRQHYCPDSEIDLMRDGTMLSRAEYLAQLVFPDKATPPGPGIRSGDFAELLISDYIEYVLGFWVPRGKYSEKASRNESAKGVDILGFRVLSSGTDSPGDTLVAYEVKAQLTGDKYSARLQNAVDDSTKDFLRTAYTLNATKRRLIRSGEIENAQLIQRFQSIADRPYIFNSGAAAVVSNASYDEAAIQQTVTTAHVNASNLALVVLRGDQLMNLVHAIYETAANEA